MWTVSIPPPRPAAVARQQLSESSPFVRHRHGWLHGVLAIAEQRRRLVDALSELAARTGADVEVIFDGGEHDQPAPPGATRQLVKTRFSPPGTEADDVILEMVERYPAHRPVVVATSDRRVRDGVRQRGANVISAGQLLKVLRRDRGW